MNAAIAQRQRTALGVAAGLTAATLVVAAIVRIGWAADARALLDFPFAGVPRARATAVSIFVDNARCSAAIFAASAIVQSPWLTRRRRRPAPCRASLVLAAVDTRARARGRGQRRCSSAPPSARTAPAWRSPCCRTGRSSSPPSRSPSPSTCAPADAPLATRDAVAVAAGCLAALALAAVLETFAAP